MNHKRRLMKEMYSVEFATKYDDMIKVRHWSGPDIVFGLMYEFINPEETLLDLGIGTGAGSLLFHRAGLRISGTDGAEEMLRVCESKGFASDLRLHDLQISPFPYQDSSFHHIVSLGVFDHFRDLETIFGEVQRILMKGGMFGFTVQDREEEMETEYLRISGDMKITLCRHSETYMKKLFEDNSLTLKKSVEFAWRGERVKAYIVENSMGTVK